MSNASLRSAAYQKWWLKGTDQGQLASEGMIQLGRIVLHQTTPSTTTQQSTFIHVATNSIQFHWIADEPPATTASLRQLRCNRCDAYFTLSHLAHCPCNHDAINYRHHLQQAIIDALRQHSTSANCHQLRAWIHHHTDKTLTATLLLSLFPPPIDCLDPVEIDQHITHSMIGAFTSSAASSAIHTLNIQPLKDGQAIITQLRLLCLTHINNFYSSFKI